MIAYTVTSSIEVPFVIDSSCLHPLLSHPVISIAVSLHLSLSSLSPIFYTAISCYQLPLWLLSPWLASFITLLLMSLYVEIDKPHSTMWLWDLQHWCLHLNWLQTLWKALGEYHQKPFKKFHFKSNQAVDSLGNVISTDFISQLKMLTMIQCNYFAGNNSAQSHQIFLP